MLPSPKRAPQGCECQEGLRLSSSRWRNWVTAPWTSESSPSLLGTAPHHTSEVRMFSSSRLNTNGFSLGCWGSDLCLIRELGSTPEVLLSPSRGMKKVSSGVSSVGSSFSPAWGTGVQGCQEEATEGALQRALLSSRGGRPLHKTELGPPERLELPERVKEMDREKDISYKNKRREKEESKSFPDNVYPKVPGRGPPPGSPPSQAQRHASTEIKYGQRHSPQKCPGLPGREMCRTHWKLWFSIQPYLTSSNYWKKQKIKICTQTSQKRKTSKTARGFSCIWAPGCFPTSPNKTHPLGTTHHEVDSDCEQEGSDLLWGGTWGPGQLPRSP